MSKDHQTFHEGFKTKITILSKSPKFNFFPVPGLGGMFVLCISGFLHGNKRGREREGDHKGWSVGENHLSSPLPSSATPRLLSCLGAQR